MLLSFCMSLKQRQSKLTCIQRYQDETRKKGQTGDSLSLLGPKGPDEETGVRVFLCVWTCQGRTEDAAVSPVVHL